MESEFLDLDRNRLDLPPTREQIKWVKFERNCWMVAAFILAALLVWMASRF
jgi:hypothetical protein